MSEPSDSQTKPDPGALRLKKRENPEEEHLRQAAEAVSAKPSSRKNPKKSVNRSGSRTLRLLGLTLGPCFLGLIVLGAFLAHQVLDWQILTPEQARLTRNIGIASFFAVVILQAFTEDLLQGILCFFLLPYTVIYGLFFADAGPIRGLTIAVLIFLGAEMFYTPEEAIVPTIQSAVNNWIQDGQDKLIQPDGRREAGKIN